MAIYGYTKNYKLIKPQFNTDTWHDYIYDNLDTIDAIMSAIYASGNWKGFWATNTAYVTGDVIIDQVTDTMYKVMADHTTSESTFAEEQTAYPDYYELWSPNNLAESWAIKMDDKVSNTDYSAKAYAISSGLIDEGSAKEWAIGSGEIGDTGEYSAKKYATDAHDDYISMTTNVNVIAVGSSIANVNAVGNSISSVNTVASNVSDVNTVADNISDVNTAASNMTAIQAAPTAASNAANSAIDSANSANASAASAQAAQDALDEVHGLLAIPIGTIFQSVYVDESRDIARQLNGQLISSTKFHGFRDWLDTVQTAIPNLFTDEATWQAEKLLSKFGQVGKFVIDDTAQTIRLPAVVNAQGLLSLSGIGNLVNESLPNHTHPVEYYITTTPGGVYQIPAPIGFTGGTPAGTDNSLGASNSAYQDNASVQQEAIQYPYYIQVATGIEETLPAIREYKVNNSDYFGKSMYSDIAPDNASWLASNGQYNARTVYPDYYDWLNSKVGQVITANGGKVVLSTGTITDYDFVVNQDDQTFRLPLLNGERVLVKKYVSGLAWYNLYSDGWLEQGGQYTISTKGQGSIDFLKQFTNSEYGFFLNKRSTDASSWTVMEKTGTRTESSVDIQANLIGYSLGGSWKACGYAPIPTQSDFTEVAGLYYYVGDTVQDASLINAGAVLGQLSDKADIDASNFNASGKSLLSGLGMPSSRYIDLTVGASGSTYTAPANGYFFCARNATAAGQVLQVEGSTSGFEIWSQGAYRYSLTVPVRKGQVVYLYYTMPTANIFRFIYAKGEN